MNDPSPYQSPQIPPGGFMPGPVKPPAVKVFGILHLVFAGLGILGVLSNLLMLIFGNPFVHFMGAGGPEMQAHVELQKTFQAQLNPATIISSILTLLVAVPMILAGIKMLKKRRDCIKWSNIYAFSSLAAKAVNIMISFFTIIPALNSMASKMTANSGQMEGVLTSLMILGGIGGIAIACIYPVLSLVILNRPAVKQWAAVLPA